MTSFAIIDAGCTLAIVATFQEALRLADYFTRVTHHRPTIRPI